MKTQIQERIYLTLDGDNAPTFISDRHGPDHDSILPTSEKRARSLGFVVPADCAVAALDLIHLGLAARRARPLLATAGLRLRKVAVEKTGA